MSRGFGRVFTNFQNLGHFVKARPDYSGLFTPLSAGLALDFGVLVRCTIEGGLLLPVLKARIE